MHFEFGKHLIKSSLDKFSCSTISQFKSDHSLTFVQFQKTEKVFASPFMFLKIWTSHPDCQRWQVSEV